MRMLAWPGSFLSGGSLPPAQCGQILRANVQNNNMPEIHKIEKPARDLIDIIRPLSTKPDQPDEDLRADAAFGTVANAIVQPVPVRYVDSTKNCYD